MKEINSVFQIFQIGIIVQVISAFEDEKTIPGIKLEAGGSFACSELNLQSSDSYQICFFIKFPLHPHVGNNVSILSLSDENSTLTLEKDSNLFFVNTNGNTKKFIKPIHTERWTRVCLVRNHEDYYIPEMKLFVNYREAKEYDWEIEKATEYEDERMGSEDDDWLNQNVTLCFGSFDSNNSLYFKIAGLTIELSSLRNDDKCINKLNASQMMSFDNYNSWNTFETELFHSDIATLCFDTYAIFEINTQSTYGEHVEDCNKFGARLLSSDEVEAFAAMMFKGFAENRMKGNFTSIHTWIAGGNTEARTLQDKCRYRVISYTEVGEVEEIHLESISCIIDINNSICISPEHSDLTYYGELVKYDRNFFVTVSEGALLLEGDEGSYISKKDNVWVLYSDLHHHSCRLNETLPTVRNWWECHKGQTVKLTFTACGSDQFACTNGDCLPKESRCNGTIECKDTSDEEYCLSVSKIVGYDSNRSPPPRKTETMLNVKYLVGLAGISDLMSDEGTAVIDIHIILEWYDPRFVFWNLKGDIPCNEIWTPILGMKDRFEKGFKVEFKPYRSSCVISNLISSSFSAPKNSYKDSYMGKYIKGEDKAVSYIFSAIVTSPCLFKLDKYPFGKQSCSLAFWIDNAFLTTSYNMTPTPFFEEENNYVKYQGRIELGEYRYIESTHKTHDSQFVEIDIKLQSLYGFHVLNSFIPSSLICILSYVTLFFPLRDFNERVMVSLTSLLVLAALFSQSSNTSVKTPYFKLLDIWYVVLVFFCFAVVIFNIFIHKVQSCREKKKKRTILDRKTEEEYEEVENDRIVSMPWKIPDSRYNDIACIFFALFYLIFLMLFIASANEII